LDALNDPTETPWITWGLIPAFQIALAKPTLKAPLKPPPLKITPTFPKLIAASYLLKCEST
jgi:hypothetical protein